MRYAPMSINQQSDLSFDMLLHFGLAEEVKSNPVHPNGGTMTSRHFKLKHVEKANKAIDISTAFFSLTEITDAPIDCEEMVLAIRYKMGYGWLAWFFVRNFAIPIIKWLWAKYHDDTSQQCVDKTPTR